MIEGQRIIEPEPLAWALPRPATVPSCPLLFWIGPPTQAGSSRRFQPTHNAATPLSEVFFHGDCVPDVFISYSRDNRTVAEQIARSLEAEGFDVWWDAVLRAGESYDEVIEDNLRSAGAVVVLWSATSVRSKWVRAEATAGERHSTLVPALIENTDVPIRYELTQTAELQSWAGDHDDPNWKRFVSDIRAALAARDQTKASSSGSISPTGDPAATDSIEEIFWSAVKDSDEPAELEAYLKRYRHGRFTDLAQSRLTELKSKTPQAEPGSPAPVVGIPRQLVAIAIYVGATIIGIMMLVFANAIHIGFFQWSPVAGAGQLETGTKEIGFYAAINWSLATLFLMPAAWTLIYLALANLKDALNEMIANRMIVTRDFAPITDDHAGFSMMQKHLRLFVVGGIFTVTAVMVILSLSDHAQVAGQFYGNEAAAEKLDRINEAGFPLETANIERDWMVASFLTSTQADSVNSSLNNIFGFLSYFLYVGIGIGSLLSFGFVMIGVGAAFLHGVAQNYGLQIIPSLSSHDSRCGFEVLQRFFACAYAVAFIGCVMIYLMGIQNIYLRNPDPHIFALLSPDFSALAGPAGFLEKIDQTIGFLFSDSVAKGTRNAYAWIFGFFIFAIFIGGFLFLLRHGAIHGRACVIEEYRSKGTNRLTQLTSDDPEIVRARLARMRVWPLARPTLAASLGFMGLLIASFVFYKLGVLILLALGLVISVHMRRASQNRSDTITATP